MWVQQKYLATTLSTMSVIIFHIFKVANQFKQDLVDAGSAI